MRRHHSLITIDMMVFTHILVGILLTSVVTIVAPYDPLLLVIVGGFGGLFPDLDMLGVHRKTFHFPVVYPILSGLLLLIGFLIGIEILIIIALGTAAAGLHSLMDILGGGKEMRPWRETDDRAAFNHVSNEWISPRRVLYDGSWPDFVLAALSGSLIALIFSGKFFILISFLIGCAFIYTLMRRLITRYIPESYPTFSSYIQEQILGKDWESE